jgi:glycosyltransferase involved in cell wall biosynthesis
MKCELEKLATSLEVANRFIFKEAIPPQDVPLAMQKMDVFVLPSMTRPNWMEQFGRVLIEAMACETPVIGSSSGEISRVIGDAGLIFPEGNVQELSACVRQLLDDPELYAQLATKGRQRVIEHFTQERIAQQIYGAYQEMISHLS